MKTPPMLVGAALLFWGWQTDFLFEGAIMALLLEGSRFVKTRWEPTNEDFSRIWTFCTVLFLATAAYAFAANDGPANVRGLLTSGGTAPDQADIGSTKTAVLLIRWLPMDFFLFLAAQALGNREGIPLETISLILQRRWKQARKMGRSVPESRLVNVAYPYFVVCLFAASTRPSLESSNYFWSMCALVAWSMWSLRSRRFGLMVWGGAMCAAIVLGYCGERGLVQLHRTIMEYNPRWLTLFFVRPNFDPLESRTELGQIGRIKTSSEIVIRLETTNGAPPPPYLREATYRVYKSTVWHAGSAKDNFANVPDQPAGSNRWPLLLNKTNTVSVTIASYLPYERTGLLPLPTTSGCLEQLPVYFLQKNTVGSVRAQGPGLVIFNALYGEGATIDAPPDDNEDLDVPQKEEPALEEIVSELHLAGESESKILADLSSYFTTKYTYSLWQRQPLSKSIDTTPLSRFLLETHTGHCEYFATATVLLLRELKIPARYTVGYAVHEASGQKYVVRQNDAHAWCRVWDKSTERWIDFDTTPGTWFDIERKQRSWFQFIGDGWSRLVFEFSKFRYGQSNLRQYILWALVPVLALLLYQIIFRSARRRARQGADAGLPGITRPGLDSEFYRLELELASRGLVRHASEPLSAWLRRTASDPGFANVSEPLQQILRLHYRYRFDPHGLTADERESLRREVAECLSQMEKVTS